MLLLENIKVRKIIEINLSWKNFFFLRRTVTALALKQGWAAVVIQRHCRGYLVRKIYQLVLRAAIIIQAYTRGWMARKRFRKAKPPVSSFVSVFLTMQVSRLIMCLYCRWWRSTRLWFCRNTLELGWCAGGFKQCDGWSSTSSCRTESSSCERRWKNRCDQTTYNSYCSRLLVQISGDLMEISIKYELCLRCF